LSELVEWSLKLGKALDHCHEKKIYHGSIKPSAIIINDSNDPILLDFKIIHNSQFNATLIVGSPPYMSPQQWQGEDETAEDDQFSMAVVLYQLISGELPYKHNGKESPSNRLDNFRRGPSPCHDVAKKNGRHQVPAAVSAVLARALHEQPTGRYGSVNEFVNEFKKSIQIYDAVHKNRQKKTKKTVFISYNSKDVKYAEDIFSGLNRMKINCWFDKLAIDPGTNWLKEIESGLTISSHAILLFGSFGFGRFQEEEYIALFDEILSPKKIIPVLLPGLDTEKLPVFLRTKNWIDFRCGITDEGLKNLAKFVSVIEGK